MRNQEVEDIENTHRFMSVVLEMVKRGAKIHRDGPFYQTYLLARQRGFVERTGPLKMTIVVSERGEDFLRRRR